MPLVGAGGKSFSGRSIARRTAPGRTPTPATVILRALLEALRRRAPPGRHRMRGRASAGLLVKPGSVRILAVQCSPVRHAPVREAVRPIAMHHTTGIAVQRVAQINVVHHTARPVVVYGHALVHGVVICRCTGPVVWPVIVRVFLSLEGAISWRHGLLIAIGSAGDGYRRRPNGVVVYVLAGVVALRVVALGIEMRVLPGPVILGRPLVLWRRAHPAVDGERLLMLRVLAGPVVCPGWNRGMAREAHWGRVLLLLLLPDLLSIERCAIYPRRDHSRSHETRLGRALLDVDSGSLLLQVGFPATRSFQGTLCVALARLARWGLRARVVVRVLWLPGKALFVLHVPRGVLEREPSSFGLHGHRSLERGQFLIEDKPCMGIVARICSGMRSE